MKDENDVAGSSFSQPRFHIGCVSYLNAKPLIFGLESQSDIDLQLDVPARLLDGLASGRFDVALLPVIDYQRLDNLAVVPVGGIGSEDETLTVRIFSKQPIASINTLACDVESHTSVALARIVLEKSFSIHPEFVTSDSADARLLIGDKVINRAPTGYPYELDLGSAWRNLTGLPFLFACWTARRDADLRDLPNRLLAARQNGMANIETIIRRDAISRGWPVATARKYLTQHLNFEVGQRQLEAVRLFHQLASELGLIPAPRSLIVMPINA
ncbi:MAG TPA: menaquinone biosynthesis protein [Tepidisphaeraceae bacterium]|nr:menaquinone biosynthesis protein [Tepidisphaeraceae bacterium]